MSKVHCEVCGLQANSKCPYCRNVFVMHNKPELELADELLSHFATINGDGTITFHQHCWDTENAERETSEKILKRAWRILHMVNEEECKVLACVHKWVFDEGEKSEIGCGHHNTKGE